MSTSSDADRYLDMHLNLACPNCGSAGLIPWQRLDRVLFCHGCERRYGVERGGLVELPTPEEDRIRVQVRTNSSEWRNHDAVVGRKPGNARVLFWLARDLVLQGRARWVLAAAVVLIAGTSIALAGRKPAAPPPMEIPDALEARAALFTESLASRDMGVLIRLTDPAQHRALRIWLAHGTGLPEPAKASAATDPASADTAAANLTSPPKAEVLSRVAVSADGGLAQLRVRLAATGGGQEAVLDEQWTRRGEAWYFQPVRLRSPVENKGPARPYVKARRR